MNKINTITILLVACLFLNCKHTEGEYHSLIEKIEAESKTFHDTIMSSEAYIGDIETIEITEGGHTFLIPERKGQITSYACIECHSKPLAEMQNATLGPKAHWDIEVVHANEDAMNCATCHNLDDMNHLKSLTGREIDFNRSYKLCSQCHTSQFEDWKGGAHGKNIGGWTKPRAAMTCVNCHNPHRPQIESKWPERYNTQKARERE
ncbi:cytochrome C [Pricia sp. S334]|uniref:Cytochrome C n=1 Tax=Pricia mediterranea TaxID=3076079 RepID=A0ABU3L9L1_9FLAO|nr:cytochrome C [Pricia sp. S334]MDT7830083.1 cytochrome C [Pricia sp. S334]